MIGSDDYRIVVSAIACIVAGTVITAITPFMVGALADDLGLSIAAVSDVVAAGTGGFVLGVITIALVGGYLSKRLMAIISIFFMLIGNASALIFHTYEPLLLIRAITGLGDGMLTSVGLGILSGLKNCPRYLGLQMLTSTFFAFWVILSIPFLLDSLGINALFSILIVYSLIALRFVCWLPRIRGSKTSVSYESSVFEVNPGIKILSVICTLLLFSGFGGFWPFVERISLEQDVLPENLSLSLSLAMLMGAGGAFIAGAVGDKYGLIKPALFACTVVTMAALMMTHRLDNASVLYLIPVFQSAFMFLIIYHNAFLASLDPTGRVLLFGLIMETSGNFLGPISSGQIIRAGGDYLIISYVMIAAVIIYVAVRVWLCVSRSVIKVSV